MDKKEKPFFIGYLPTPKALKSFLIKASLLIVVSFTAGGLLAGLSQDDPGEAGFRFDYGRQTVSGVIETTPYPILYVTSGNERIETGRTIMLAGQGKSGVRQDLETLQGKIVDASGIILKRGDLDMLQLANGQRGLKLSDETETIPESISLGKWRLQGEICDGKCLAGAMQPGRGLSHKACAILCLAGNIPPVFVATQPIEGSEFLLVGAADGGPLPETAYDYIGQFVEVDAEIERRGDMLVMLVDTDNVKVIP